MNETSKFKVESCRPKTMVFQALTFDTESWKPKALGFWDSTFGIESWIPWALCFSSSTFGIKSWILGALCSLFSTFDTKSWKPKESSFRFSTFGIKSWKPRTKCSWSSTFDTKSCRPRALKVGNQEPNAFSLQLPALKIKSQDLFTIGFKLLASKVKNQCKIGFHFSTLKVGDVYSWIKRILFENKIWASMWVRKYFLHEIYNAWMFKWPYLSLDSWCKNWSPRKIHQSHNWTVVSITRNQQRSEYWNFLHNIWCSDTKCIIFLRLLPPSYYGKQNSWAYVVASFNLVRIIWVKVIRSSWIDAMAKPSSIFL